MGDSHSIISSSETAFPRGGSTILTPLEVKEISNEATSDVLFEVANSNKRTISSKGEQPAKKQKKSKKKTEEDPEEKTVQIENFNFKNLTPGSSILGQITSIGKMDLTISIGDNLVGYVPITSISEEITSQLEELEDEDSDMEDEETKPKVLPKLNELFKIGQWLRAKIVKPEDEKKRRIQLTIEPSSVNEGMEEDDLIMGNIVQCSIKSLEDHGLILNTGLKGFSGFISKKEITNSKDVEIDDLKPGSVLLATVIAKQGSRTITLRPAQSSANSTKVAITQISSIDSIQPGILVDALVASITKYGLTIRVFGLVDGSINLAHVQGFDLKTLEHKYTVGNSFKARVTGVLLQSGTKKIVLSAASHILGFDAVPNDTNALEAFPNGHIFEDAEIVGADNNYLYTKFGTNIYGQVHNSRIDPNLDLQVHYQVGSKHKARVIGYNQMDNLLILTFEPSVIESQYLGISEVPSGSSVGGAEIIKVLPDNGGIIVKVLNQFDALVPGNHMSDIKLVYPERKFKLGTKVKARVLNNYGNKLYITLKKSLVNIEDEQVLASFENAVVGLKTPATVERFVHNGAIVSFFGPLRAFLPKNEISETFVAEASDYLKLGQTVNVKILEVKPEQKRLMVTLRQSAELSVAQQETITELIPGKSVVQASIVEKVKDSVVIELVGSGLRGVIYSGQLGDGNYEQNRVLAKKLPIGEKIDVLVLEKDNRSRTVIVTAKQSLIDASKQDLVPSSFKDIAVDDKMLYGYIKSVTNMGLFVCFGGRLTGLVLAKYASETGEDLSKKYYKYQSVACRVISIDEDNKRFLLDLSQADDSLNTEEVINPVDASKKTFGNYIPGVITKGTITSTQGAQLTLQLADNLQGRVDVSQCFNSWDEIKDKKNPLSKFTIGSSIDVKVIGFYDAKTHKFSTISHRKSNKSTMLELTILKKELAAANVPFKATQLHDISKDSELTVYINSYSKGFVWVSIAPNVRGRISSLELTDDVESYVDLENNIPVGMALKATVKDIDTQLHAVVLGARKQIISSIKDVEIGQTYPVRILKVRDTFVLCEFGKEVVGSAYVTDALNDYSEQLESVYHQNDYAVATVLDISGDKIAVSLRSADAKDKAINSVSDLERGDVVKGFVKSIANNGLYVALGRSTYALVRVTDLSDAYLQDWKKYFKVHQLVVGKISACKEEGRILMTLKESEVNGDLNVMKKLDELVVGEIFEGSVKRVTDFGVFIKLDGTLNVSGLCHHSQISDNAVQNVTSLFGEGDRVKVKILSIDTAKQQLSLGMKASYFESGVVSEEEEMEVDEANAGSEADSEESDSDVDMAGDESDDEEENESVSEGEVSEKSSGLSTRFDWTASILDQAEDDESSSEDEDFTRKKKKRVQKVEDKTGDMNTRAPQSVSDFERLLIGNPNLSIIWMNYMSFQLQLSEVERAREIGERALKTIAYREEQEKMNIWIAMLNLENTFGSEESLDEVFKRACQYMDSMVMHQKLVGIYTMSEKHGRAESLYQLMTKKFGQHVSVWVQYGAYLLGRKQHDGMHQVLAKALQILPKRDHVEVVRKYAQLEFNNGDPEQARSLFEGLIADAPKRIDLWNVYIDQEIKLDNKTKVEDLFGRALAKKLSRKQAKFFFSKWLAYEEEKGDEQMAARVKAKAAEYVQGL